MDTTILFSEAFGQLKYHARRLLPVLTLPLVVVVFANHLHSWAASNVLAEVFITLLGIFFYIAIAIIVHRAILIGGDAIRPREVLIPRSRAFVYLVYFIGLSLLMIPLAVFAFVPLLGEVLMMIGFGYFFSRLCLILPTIAIDRNACFGDSWRMTSKHQLTMFCSIGVFPILAGFVEKYAYLIPHIGQGVGSVISAFLIVYTTAMISVAYERLRD